MGLVMETKFNFKSQICTDKNQSERLLALGLKKETADMGYLLCGNEYAEYPLHEIHKPSWDRDIPAWSLHRLMILAEMKGTAFSELDTAYETTISIIAAKIRFGYFNKEYLV
jgi:hypothetical protein